MNADVLYNTLSSRAIGGLVGLALAMGIASVSFVYIRRAQLDETWSGSGDLWRHLLLLFSITLFVVFIDVAYEIEFYKGERVSQGITEFRANDASAIEKTFLPRLRLLLLLPIDLVGIGIISALFGVLLVFGLNRDNWSGPSFTTAREVKYLFVLTIAWHVAMIGWWTVYGLTANDFGSILPDIGVQLVFAMLESISVVLFSAIGVRKFGRSHGGTVAWIGAIAYSATLILFYSVRLWGYSLKFFTS